MSQLKDISKYNTGSEQVLRGVVKRVNFRSADGQYSVLQIMPSGSNETITTVGYCLPFALGCNLIIHGHYSTHPKYGTQFNAIKADEIIPDTEHGLVKYLGSGLLPGIGPKTAKKIIANFGTSALDVIRQSPEKLAGIPGFSKKKADKLSGILNEHVDKQAQERFFVEHDITPNLARRIINKYGNSATAIVKSDPYRLALEMSGIGFSTADTIALKLGFALTAPERLRGAIYHTLQAGLENGHTYLPEADLLIDTKNKLNLDQDINFAPHLEELIASAFIIREESRIFLKYMWEAERFVADFVNKRSKPFGRPLVDALLLEQCLNNAEADLKLKFSPEQRLAVKYATEYPLVIITGGPGCGKTTIIRALAKTFSSANHTIALAAPTGKAAQRMSQVTGHIAGTVHRLLKFDPRSGEFFYNNANPIRIGLNDDEEGELIDAVIIDEASMLDLQLAKDLFSAIPKNATIILVGDKDQLPSVGPGKVFHDLVSIAKLKIIGLNQLFRRAEESNITLAAHSINSGNKPNIPQPDGNTKSDAYFINRDTPEECARLIESLVAEQIPQKFNIPTTDITVLTPTNRGPLGTIELNKRLQDKINPIEKSRQKLLLKDSEFRLGDRVCQRVNNYKIDLFGVYNGDIGEVHQIYNDTQSLAVELWDGRIVNYNINEANQLSLAYALTVHRSQGSELPCVVLAIHTSHFTLLERQLLYTAATRAKKLLIIVGNSRSLDIAVSKVSSKKRLSYLRERILGNADFSRQKSLSTNSGLAD